MFLNLVMQEYILPDDQKPRRHAPTTLHHPYFQLLCYLIFYLTLLCATTLCFATLCFIMFPCVSIVYHTLPYVTILLPSFLSHLLHHTLLYHSLLHSRLLYPTLDDYLLTYYEVICYSLCYQLHLPSIL